MTFLQNSATFKGLGEAPFPPSTCAEAIDTRAHSRNVVKTLLELGTL